MFGRLYLCLSKRHERLRTRAREPDRTRPPACAPVHGRPCVRPTTCAHVHPHVRRLPARVHACARPTTNPCVRMCMHARHPACSPARTYECGVHSPAHARPRPCARTRVHAQLDMVTSDFEPKTNMWLKLLGTSKMARFGCGNIMRGTPSHVRPRQKMGTHFSKWAVFRENSSDLQPLQPGRDGCVVEGNLATTWRAQSGGNLARIRNLAQSGKTQYGVSRSIWPLA